MQEVTASQRQDDRNEGVLPPIRSFMRLPCSERLPKGLRPGVPERQTLILLVVSVTETDHYLHSECHSDTLAVILFRKSQSSR